MHIDAANQISGASAAVSALLEIGQNGTITIQLPKAPSNGKIQPLGKSPLEPQGLTTQRCAALAGGKFSSFTVAGRDSLPANRAVGSQVRSLSLC